MARFRRTALPTRRAATIPTCGGPMDAGTRSTVIPPERLATPVRKTVLNRAAGLNETNGRPFSGSELPPALEAAALDHGAPRTGPHSDTKSVLPLASSRVGLVGTLHGEVSPIGRSRCDREDYGRRKSTPIPVLSAFQRGEREVPLRTAKLSGHPRNIGSSRFRPISAPSRRVVIIPRFASPCTAGVSPIGGSRRSRPTVGFPRLAACFAGSIYSPPVLGSPPYFPGEDGSGRGGKGRGAWTEETDFSTSCGQVCGHDTEKEVGISRGGTRLVHRGVGDLPPAGSPTGDAGCVADVDRTTRLEC